MRDHAIFVSSLLLTATLAIGCQSKEDKCRESAERNYKEYLAACKDEACKAKLADYRPGFMKECMK